MKRRSFLALALIPKSWAGTAYPVRFPKASPFEAYRKFIEPGSDEFACEAEAMAITSQPQPAGTRVYPLHDGVSRVETKKPGEYRVAYRKGGKTLSETIASSDKL